MAIQLFVPTFETEECLKEIKECLESINMFAGCGFRSISDAYIYENGQSDIEYYERTDLDGAI